MGLERFGDKKYYNLLVTGDEEAWEGTTYKAELNRFLEFTDMKVKSKFSNLEDDGFKEYLKYEKKNRYK